MSWLEQFLQTPEEILATVLGVAVASALLTSIVVSILKGGIDFLYKTYIRKSKIFLELIGNYRQLDLSGDDTVYRDPITGDVLPNPYVTGYFFRLSLYVKYRGINLKQVDVVIKTAHHKYRGELIWSDQLALLENQEGRAGRILTAESLNFINYLEQDYATAFYVCIGTKEEVTEPWEEFKFYFHDYNRSTMKAVIKRDDIDPYNFTWRFVEPKEYKTIPKQPRFGDDN